MMAILSLLLSVAWAATDCELYSLTGELSQVRTTLELKVNKGTKSERTFIVKGDRVFKLLPYVNKTLKGEFVIKDKEIRKTHSVDLSVPDPLNHSQEMVKLKDLPCP